MEKPVRSGTVLMQRICHITERSCHRFGGNSRFARSQEQHQHGQTLA
jgi:hypothetical protein